MVNADEQFLTDLQREDDLGLVVRGHLHIEHQLIEVASACLPRASQIDWNEVSFRPKREIAHGCGLPADRKNLILKLNWLRNQFAHSLSASIERKDIVNIYNSLSSQIRETIKGAHLHMGLGVFPGPAAMEPRDLLVHLFISARQATKAASNALRGAT